MVGVTASPENGQPMLAVAKVETANRNAVIGVAKEAVAATTVTLEDGTQSTDFAPVSGLITPNGHLVIITSGLAPAVKVTNLALLADAEIGAKVAISGSGELALAIDEAAGVVVGRVADAIDQARGTIPLFIDID